MNIERRIAELEGRSGTGRRVLLIHPDETEAQARARDEAVNGPVGDYAIIIRVEFGPEGLWIDTPEGRRWRYPDGRLTNDPVGDDRRALPS